MSEKNSEHLSKTSFLHILLWNFLHRPYFRCTQLFLQEWHTRLTHNKLSSILSSLLIWYVLCLCQTKHTLFYVPFVYHQCTWNLPWLKIRTKLVSKPFAISSVVDINTVPTRCPVKSWVSTGNGRSIWIFLVIRKLQSASYCCQQRQFIVIRMGKFIIRNH